MPEWFYVLLSTLAIPLLVAVVTAVITVRLSLRRFRTERWWEHRADAYSRIVEALYNVMEYCSEQSRAALRGADMREDVEKRLSQTYERAYRELKKVTAIGAYIISDEVAEALTRLEARPRLDPAEYAFYEILDADHEAYTKTLAEVRRLAKKDLGV